MIVLDTNALLFWTLEPARLSAPARAALSTLDAARRGRVCAASLWEIAIKVRAGRLDLAMSPGAYLDRLGRLPLDVEPVDARLWLESVDLIWDHRDPVDRLVVALARRHQASLVTSDAQIHAFERLSIW